MRDKSRRAIAGMVGLGAVIAAAVAVAAAPAGAALACSPVVTKTPKACKPVKPIATTLPATHVRARRAILNGISGPNVAGGDITTYFFKYGKTKGYGHQTPPGMVGSCPPGVGGNPGYCPSVPAQQHVSATASGLLPCTLYHFKIVSQNPNGRTSGADMTFTTAFAYPIQSVNVSPNEVKRGRLYRVTISLRFTADVTIELRRGGQVVKTYHPGVHKAGTFSKTFKAPDQTGKYVLRVLANSHCGTQTKDKSLTVTP